MVIVKMSGGLGNQMFQYALYRKIQQTGKDVKLDLSSFQDKHQPYLQQLHLLLILRLTDMLC